MQRICKRLFHTIFAPTLPESIQVGAIAKWIKFSNEKVKRDELLCIFECEKGVIDIYSPVSGKVLKHLVKINEDIKPGTSVMTIEDSVVSVKFSKEFFGKIKEKKLN